MKEPVLSKSTDSQHCSDRGGTTQNPLDKCSWADPYSAIFENAKNAILVTDLNGDFKDLNTGACLMLGYTKEELLQLNIKTLFAQGNKKPQSTGIELLAKKENVNTKAKITCKNGDLIAAEVNLNMIGPDRILVTTREIAKRKNTEAVLQDYGTNLLLFFEKIEMFFLLLDSRFRIISFNPSAFEFAKKELGHGIGKSEYFPGYFNREQRPGLLASMNEALEGGSVNYEQKFLKPDGSTHWYKISMGPVSPEDKAISGLIITATDISEIKYREKELLKSKVQEQKNYLRAALKDQETERNNIGQELHDNVNQILSTIRLYLGMIENHELMGNELINKSKAAIDLVIEEIRLISRRQVTPQRKFDLGELIGDLIRNLNENTKVSIKFDTRFAIDCPIDEDLKLNIYRIVQEQINNILKHAAATKVSISVRANSDVLKLKITDNGIGFDPLLKRKGIGISNMFNRVESYDGEFVLRSRPGAGCKLEISIPNFMNGK